MSSRLFEEVREKRGLAYEIGSQAKRFEDCGAFVVHAGVDISKVLPALELILKEIKRTSGALVTAEELRRAKDFFLGQLTLSLEETMDTMLWIGESTAVLDKIYKIEEIIKEVKKITPRQIREAASAIFKRENLALALIGPLQGRETEIRDRLRI